MGFSRVVPERTKTGRAGLEQGVDVRQLDDQVDRSASRHHRACSQNGRASSNKKTGGGPDLLHGTGLKVSGAAENWKPNGVHYG